MKHLYPSLAKCHHWQMKIPKQFCICTFQPSAVITQEHQCVTGALLETNYTEGRTEGGEGKWIESLFYDWA